MQSKFFKANKLYPNVTQISGLGGELAYLIEGEERALLIDGLTGTGSLKSFVRELTEKPVMLAITHGHLDHMGAAFEYGECYIHPDDIALMYTEEHSSVEARMGYANAPSPMGGEKATTAVLSDVFPACPVKTYPIYEGDIFDLGGVQIEVIEVPGHTYGTVVFLDRAARVTYSGDACNINTLLGIPGSTTVEEYRESLIHFKTYQPDFDVTYGGHVPFAIPNTIIDDGIAMCDRILAGTDEAVETMSFFGKPVYMGASLNFADLSLSCGGYCNIVYDKAELYKRPHPVIKGEPNLYK